MRAVSWREWGCPHAASISTGWQTLQVAAPRATRSVSVGYMRGVMPDTLPCHGPVCACREWRQTYCTVYPQLRLAELMIAHILPLKWSAEFCAGDGLQPPCMMGVCSSLCVSQPAASDVPASRLQMREVAPGSARHSRQRSGGSWARKCRDGLLRMLAQPSRAGSTPELSGIRRPTARRPPRSSGRRRPSRCRWMKRVVRLPMQPHRQRQLSWWPWRRRNRQRWPKRWGRPCVDGLNGGRVGAHAPQSLAQACHPAPLHRLMARLPAYASHAGREAQGQEGAAEGGQDGRRGCCCWRGRQCWGRG